MRLTPDDFEIEQTEQVVRSSTVLMLDLSLSMPMRDNFLAAKKVAMALHSLISMQFPRDFLGIVGFSEVARDHQARAAARGVVGLRLRHEHAARRSMLSRQLLARQTGTKQIIMITDGEPTAHFETGHGAAVLQLPAGAGDDRRHAPRGRPLHARTASASTRSCSTPRRTCRPSSRSSPR